jgi:hypothetical protein
MVVRRMPRIQDVVIPLLRTGLGPGVTVGSWIGDVDDRVYPIINIRRLGGLAMDIDFLDLPVIEMTVYHSAGLVECEDLYLDAREVLQIAVDKQTQTTYGYLHSMFETLGPTQFDSPFEETWRIQGLIQLGLRPKRQE